MNRQVRGAAGELLACAYLLSSGYFVYRSQSPSAPFDLVAYKDSCLRVEVKTISWMSESTCSFCRARNREWDLLLAVDLNTGRVFEVWPEESHADSIDRIRVELGVKPALRHGNKIE